MSWSRHPRQAKVQASAISALFVEYQPGDAVIEDLAARAPDKQITPLRKRKREEKEIASEGERKEQKDGPPKKKKLKAGKRKAQEKRHAESVDAADKSKGKVDEDAPETPKRETGADKSVKESEKKRKHKHRHHDHSKRHHTKSHDCDDATASDSAPCASEHSEDERRKEKREAKREEKRKRREDKRTREDDERTKRSLYAHLPKELIEADANGSWNFEFILDNSPSCDRKEKPSVDKCSCCYVAGEAMCCNYQCLNYTSKTECEYGRCEAGLSCRNSRMQLHQNVPVAPFLTRNKGWGLVTLVNLQPGQFVIEYVGEIISAEMCQQRLEERKGARNLYMLTLNPDEVLDATYKGNVARFINHSCNPNCRTEKWLVRGFDRVGIFAKQHIAAGTELTFDYQFQRFGSEKQPCHCGQPNCSGFLGDKHNGIDTVAAPGRSSDMADS